MMVVTGAYGFIGSCMVKYLNSLGINDVVAIDDLDIGWGDPANLDGCKVHDIQSISFSPEDIIPSGKIDAVFHFGAISNTLEKDSERIDRYNVRYTKILSDVCKDRKIPMIFSSTAAVYGNGSGPLNKYAQSKLDSEAMIKDSAVCFRLFNVYGPNENHKGRMSSVMLKWFNELRKTGSIKIFENSSSYKRDFIYVDDVCRVAYAASKKYQPGVYDLGTGVAESFERVADCVLGVVGYGTKQYISMPNDLRDQYQLNTIADNKPIIGLKWIDSPLRGIDMGISTYYKNDNHKINSGGQ